MIAPDHTVQATLDDLTLPQGQISTHAPRILFPYGSLREQSYSRLLTAEAARIIAGFGAEVRLFDPHGLPILGSVVRDHPKVAEPRNLVAWSEGEVWVSPELHGMVAAVLKNQIEMILSPTGAAALQ